MKGNLCEEHIGKRRDTMLAPTVHVGNDRLRIGKLRRLTRLVPAVSPMSAAPTCDTENNKNKKNRNGVNIKLRLAYGRQSKYILK